MATFLRVVPTEIYDKLMSDGGLETELLRNRLKKTKSLKTNHIGTAKQIEYPQANQVMSEAIQKGGSAKMCKWVSFDDKFKLSY